VVIEVPMGGRNKYEIDKATGLLRLDRVLYGAVYYPANFVPQTCSPDGDAVDVLVFGQEAVQPLTIVEVHAIGLIEMRDDQGGDDKLLAVNDGDPSMAQIGEIRGSRRSTCCAARWFD
jgi:inorganic pyrophosphatase